MSSEKITIKTKNWSDSTQSLKTANAKNRFKFCFPMNCRYTTKCNPMVSEYKKPVGISFLLSFTTFRHKFTLNLPIWKIAKHRIVWLWLLLSVRSPRMTWSGFFCNFIGQHRMLFARKSFDHFGEHSS